MNSCIYEGQVRHRRFSPAPVSFQYSLYMMYLDLEELPHLFDRYWLWSVDHPNVAWFNRRDHAGRSAAPLDQAIRDLVHSQTGRAPEGPIRLLTHLRYYGYGFNPVSFYFCLDPDAMHVETIVAEVNNTPWGEQHCYVLGPETNEGRGQTRRHRFRKTFHVSPFMDMDVGYDWRFTKPGPTLSIHMDNLKGDHKFFDATMRLKRRDISSRALAGVLLRYPFMTGKVIGAIYFQALRLWLHNVPFYPHPRKEAPRATARKPCS